MPELNHKKREVLRSSPGGTRLVLAVVNRFVQSTVHIDHIKGLFFKRDAVLNGILQSIVTLEVDIDRSTPDSCQHNRNYVWFLRTKCFPHFLCLYSSTFCFPRSCLSPFWFLVYIQSMDCIAASKR